MKKTIFCFVSCLIASLLFTCCTTEAPISLDEMEKPSQGNSQDNQGETDKPNTQATTEFHCIPLSFSQKSTLEAQSKFAEELLWNLIENNDPTDNIFISPLSVSVFLSMLANGTDEPATCEILNALNVPDVESLNSLYQTLVAELAGADNQVNLALANSLWLNTSFNVRPEYISMLTDIYSADIFTRELGTVETKETINSWVAEKTLNMIPDFLDLPLNPLTKMVNINATYFNGKWTFPFNEEDTDIKDFLNSDKTISKVPMMSVKELRLLYNELYDGQYLEVPYGNMAYQMCLYLPDSGMPSDIQNIKNAFAAVTGQKIFNATVNLTLPKFEISYINDNLKDPLRKMGIVKIFDSTYSPFSPILVDKIPLHVSNVINKSKFAVSESGAEAASATAGRYVGSSGLQDDDQNERNIEFNANRPFILFIKEFSTNAILFMGVTSKL